MTGKFSIYGERANDLLASLMLGEIGELPINDFSISENRFDIEVLEHVCESALLKIEPLDFAPATVVFSNEKNQLSAEFQCSLRFASVLSSDDENFRFRVHHKLFAFSVYKSRNIINWTFNPDFDVSNVWSELRNNLILLKMLMAGDCHIACFSKTGKFLEGTIIANSVNIDVEEEFIVALDAVDSMYRFPNHRHFLCFSINEFISFSSNNQAFCYLLSGSNRRIMIETIVNERPKHKHASAKILFASIFKCNGSLTAMALIIDGSISIKDKKVQMKPDKSFVGYLNQFVNRSECVAALIDFNEKYARSLGRDEMLISDRSLTKDLHSTEHLLGVK